MNGRRLGAIQEGDNLNGCRLHLSAARGTPFLSLIPNHFVEVQTWYPLGHQTYADADHYD
jgi:hypothetical protein